MSTKQVGQAPPDKTGYRRMPIEQERISRRSFFAHTAVGVGLVVSGGLGCATGLVYRAPFSDNVAVVNLSDLPELSQREPVIVQLPDSIPPVILTQTGDAQFAAVSAECTHLGCYVRASRRFLQCPCHGSTFDVEGNVLRGPAQAPLQSYPVEVKADRLEIIIR